MRETLKCRIRGVSIKYSAARKRNRNNTIKDIETELNMLKLEIVNSNEPETVNSRIQEIDAQLDHYRKWKTMGNIIRSKCQYYELGEKGTQYFHSLEKRNQEINFDIIITPWMSCKLVTKSQTHFSFYNNII